MTLGPQTPKPRDARELPSLAPLTVERRWCCWSWESVVINGKGKWTKPPRQPDGSFAKNNNPETWATFEDCWRRVMAGKADGVGFMMHRLPSRVLTAIDLDHVRDPSTGDVVAWAQDVVSRCASYTEETPSGAGLRVLGISEVGAIHRNIQHPSGVGSFELYANTARYITVSGRVNGYAVFGDITAIVRDLAALGEKPKKQVRCDTEAPGLGGLSPEIVELLTDGTKGGLPAEDRSQAFARVVRHLRDKGLGFASALALLEAYPRGVQAKYAGRLEGELERVWGKIEADADPEADEIRLEAGKRHEAADAGLAAMMSAGVPFHQRDQKLVRVARLLAKTMNGDTVAVPGIIPVTAPLLMRALGLSARWRKHNERKNRWVPCDPPDPIAQQILSMAGEWPFPPIRGVISTQTMRPDGTLLTEPGYDPATGFVLFEPPPMPAVPAAPTKADALEALKDIDALFDEFPFANPASRSVALSLDMSLILRPAMTVVPLHVTNAPEGGTGKSYIFDVVSVHSVGEKCPAIARGSTYEETEKRLIGAGLEGRSLILLDNCNGELRSEFLCQAVERPLIKPRPLGTSVMPTIPNGFVCGANGNNIEISEDLVRRTLQCSLDANMEQPYLRSFKRNPVHDILADRGKYVAAVLTIARAYIQAGRPDRPTHLASFEEWSDLVRGSLIWLGRVDPVETIAKLSIADPVREQRAKAFAILADIMGESFAVPDVIRASKDNEALSGALLTVVKSKKGDETAVSPDSLGWWLRRNAGRIADGYKLIRNEAGRWSLVRTKQMHSEYVPF